MLSLVLSITLISQSVFSAPVVENLTVLKGEKINILSPDYPAIPPGGTNIKWNIKTEANNNLFLFCDDVRISISDNCEKGYFMVYDGVREEKFCGSEHGLSIKSVGIEMRIEFDLNWAQGVAKCTVEGVKIEDAQVTDDNINGQDVELIPGKDAFDKINFQSVPRNSYLKWSFSTIPGAFISIHCVDIVLKSNCDKAKLELADNDGKDTICETQTKYKKISTSNKLTVELVIGDAYDVVLNCLVQAITGKKVFEYGNIASEEIDSSEFGKQEGSRQTDCKCGWSAKSPGRIVNGQEVEDGAYPWMVSLHRGGHRCGGSIITGYHILTAAHCTVNTEPSDWIAYMGTINNSHTENGQQIRVKEIINHDYEAANYHYNDISILVLENKIEFNHRIGPICLTPEQVPLDHKMTTVSGWGNLGKESDWVYPEQLMRAHMRVVDYNTCSYLWFRAFNTSDRKKLCTYATNRDSCYGDSGGPVFWLDPETNRYTQIGLVSFGRGCNSDYPNINTNVAYYYPWIQEVIKKTRPEVQTCKKI